MSDHVDMLTIIIFLVGLLVFGLLAVRFGAEQRPGFDERPEAPGPHHYGLS